VFGQATGRLQDDYSTNSRRRYRIASKSTFLLPLFLSVRTGPVRASRSESGHEVGDCCFIIADKARGDMYKEGCR
jgi:hypothetical protein